MARLLALLTTCAALACACAVPAAAAPLDRLPAGLGAGIFSPVSTAAAERALAPLGLRYLYLTGGVRDGRKHDAGRPDGNGLTEWFDESAAARQTPVLSYYQLQPSSTRGRDEKARVASVLRNRTTMRAYWRDLRAVLKRAAGNPDQLVVLHVEPDGWQFLEQLQGARTRAEVASTGVKELRGLPNDARGYARAFVRLRDRHAPNVALGFHLSKWGIAQKGVGSVENSTEIGRVRAAFVAALGARFDLAVTDPAVEDFDAVGFPRHLALLRAFRQGTGLPMVLWQIPMARSVDWLLGGSAAARENLAAERAAGVVGLLWDAGLPEERKPGRSQLFAGAAAAYRDGVLG